MEEGWIVFPGGLNAIESIQLNHQGSYTWEF